MRLVVLRHGQSRYNLLGLCNDSDVAAVELTDEGVAQAQRAARQLADERFEAIFCSPLLRARQTAGIIAAAQSCPLNVDERLRDIRSGFDGRPVADYLAAIAGDALDTGVNGGESLRAYAARVGGFLDTLSSQPAQSVLVVAHEETLRVIHAYCAGVSLDTVVGRAFGNCEPQYYQSCSEKRSS